MKKDEDIGFFRMIFLNLITMLQVSTINRSVDLYLFFTKLHFRVYFREGLEENMLNDTYDFKKAQARHANMCMQLHMDSIPKNREKLFYNMFKKTFKDNLLLDMRI